CHRESVDLAPPQAPDRTTPMPASRGYRDHQAALEPGKRHASKLKGPILSTEQRVPPTRSGDTPGPADLSSGLRTQDAETRGRGGGRLDTALPHAHNLQDGPGHYQSVSQSGET